MISGNETIEIVKPFSQIRNELENSPQSNYLCNYLNSLDVITYVIEDDYIDKDYLIDYSKFYARSFQDINKFTKRLHFFSESFTNEDFSALLSNGNKNIFQKLANSYLGFIVVKPIRNIRGDALIGRTILKTYPNEVNNGDKRYYLNETHQVYLFGIPLEVKSLPFQTQDTVVGACATTACWTTLQPLKSLFGIQKDSPFEITEKSVLIPSLENRNFPNNGLTILQMKSYFNSINLETEFIDINNIEKLKNYTNNDDVVADAVKAYIKMNLPIIATLKLFKEEKVTDLHAAVISGFRHKNGVLNELYVHDDQIGPYCKTLPNENFSRWINEWVNVNGYTDVLVHKLMIPIYPKIRLSFNSIYQIYLDYKRKLEIRSEGLIPDLYLIEAKKYKNYLCKHCIFDNKEKILRKPFPRFLWIIRLHFHGMPIIDYIYDATSVYPKERNITFKY
ncbi:MAG TPA: hypothetical protein C5S51_01935 [Methanosarcinaceae archaeon]|nr:hypothetical protein [Methanosarcinaceae archaeon]